MPAMAALLAEVTIQPVGPTVEQLPVQVAINMHCDSEHLCMICSQYVAPILLV